MSAEDKRVDDFIKWCETYPNASTEEMVYQVLFLDRLYHGNLEKKNENTSS